MGVSVALYGLKILDDAKASMTWPYVPGKITQSRKVIFQDADSGASYKPEIEYTYAVGNEILMGRLVAFGLRFKAGPEEFADTYVKRYQVGRSVRVYYDLTNPKRSVLEPIVLRSIHHAIAAGVGFAVIGLLLAILFHLGHWYGH